MDIQLGKKKQLARVIKQTEAYRTWATLPQLSPNPCRNQRLTSSKFCITRRANSAYWWRSWANAATIWARTCLVGGLNRSISFNIISISLNNL